MRRTILISIGIILLALLLPLLLVSGPGVRETPQEPEAEPTPFPFSLRENWAEGELDSALVLKVLVGDQVQELTMAEYLVGVVSAEMPVAFHPEALKAQAAAARTYTLYKMMVEPSSRHPDAYVCDDYACCKAYKSPGTLAEQWGENYPEYIAIMSQAVAETDGMVMLYEGSPILAAFHSSSSGQTEASGSVWSPLPYLQSVRTFESEQEVPGYYTTVELTYQEFRETVEGQVEGVSLGDDTAYWITDAVRGDTGRLEALTIGGVQVSGTAFRTMFGLRSTAVSFDFGEQGMTITTSGYGHGVGMSQYGANTLAELGLGYSEILDWYYTDIQQTTMSTLFPEPDPNIEQ